MLESLSLSFFFTKWIMLFAMQFSTILKLCSEKVSMPNSMEKSNQSYIIWTTECLETRIFILQLSIRLILFVKNLIILMKSVSWQRLLHIAWLSSHSCTFFFCQLLIVCIASRLVAYLISLFLFALIFLYRSQSPSSHQRNSSILQVQMAGRLVCYTSA